MTADRRARAAVAAAEALPSPTNGESTAVAPYKKIAATQRAARVLRVEGRPLDPGADDV
jgi:hypothetical protein